MGWAAAGLVVLLPGPLALSLRYWPETLGAFFFAAVCLTLVQAERIKTRTSRFAGAGLLCGLLALVRTNAISLIPVVAVWTLLAKAAGGAPSLFYCRRSAFSLLSLCGTTS